MNKIIWPSLVLSHFAKVFIVVSLVVSWCSTGLYKYLYHEHIDFAHLCSVILIYAIGCFIFDRDLPIGTIAMNYEAESSGNQFGRFLITIICLICYWYVVLRVL